jgi:hypothetical protein
MQFNASGRFAALSQDTDPRFLGESIFGYSDPAPRRLFYACLAGAIGRYAISLAAPRKDAGWRSRATSASDRKSAPPHHDQPRNGRAPRGKVDRSGNLIATISGGLEAKHLRGRVIISSFSRCYSHVARGENPLWTGRYCYGRATSSRRQHSFSTRVCRSSTSVADS